MFSRLNPGFPPPIRSPRPRLPCFALPTRVSLSTPRGGGNDPTLSSSSSSLSRPCDGGQLPQESAHSACETETKYRARKLPARSWRPSSNGWVSTINREGVLHLPRCHPSRRALDRGPADGVRRRIEQRGEGGVERERERVDILGPFPG